MRIIVKMITAVTRTALKFPAHRKLSHLRNPNPADAAKLANAIQDTLNNDLSPEEKQWIDKIGQLKKALGHSAVQISIRDYGTGGRHDKRTAGEMENGVLITKKVRQVCHENQPYFWSLLLFKIIREFKPSIGIELGTSLGISGAYQASAQKLNKKGRFITLEGAESLASIARRNFQSLALDNAHVVTGRFQDTLPGVLKEQGPIDYAFIDGHHDEGATTAYFEQMLPHLSKKSVVILDDISWTAGMRRAWKKIKENERVKIALDLKMIGICVLDETVEEKYEFRIPLV